MAITTKQTENVSAYPATPAGLSDDAAALDAAMIWARIEAYTAHRFSDRQVVWLVEGEGAWTPPLTPVTALTAEKWEMGAWVAATLPDGPYGYYLPSDGPYRITAQVGAGPVPSPLSEAFKRLAEYMADDPGRVGTSEYIDKTGPLEETIKRNPAWLARAMQYSGAADLLRSYRRA